LLDFTLVPFKGSCLFIVCGDEVIDRFAQYKCMRLTNPTYHFAAEFVEVGG